MRTSSALPPERIAAADYRALEGVNCIYVETEPDEAGYVERYWGQRKLGTLGRCGARMRRRGRLPHGGADGQLRRRGRGGFHLPNGTVLYEPAVAAAKEISEND